MKLAIVGGGPAGFYVASRVLSRTRDAAVRVHMFDRLWAPHGLVRYGVAPDHPEVKNCTHKFDKVAADNRFRFFGNVNVTVNVSNAGSDVLALPLQDIQDNYSHLVFATGCTLPTQHPALPPSPWCMPALSFVHWYTQHPEMPPPPPLHAMTRVALIGNGNVALDIARILLTPPANLKKYDVPQSVLAILERSAVTHVDIVARRGPLHAAFAAKELRELLTLPDASMVPIPSALLAVPPDTTSSRQQSRILQLLQQGSKNVFGTTRKTWALHFFMSPTALVPPVGADFAQLQLAQTTVDAAGRVIPGARAPPLATSLVVPSLGLRADPALGPLRTRAGCVLSADGERVLRGVYAAGWAATGARGVIASTMMDAYGVADALLADASAEASAHNVSEGVTADLAMNPAPIDDLPPPRIRDAHGVTTYDDWKRVDAEEVRRGAVLGKERERMRWEEARSFLGS
ncbi:ferredoxin adrenodoxin reductase [Mycena pura]|uniref:NADPH:adrenodoxin oxidoreductase, mitochondrial n=1 Tax=Mycena pura TaxID=153505 RepID=A0AAD7E2K9_9AGAR|nr:ferredoxin adrenodoxin reductase [Mycena pura]